MTQEQATRAAIYVRVSTDEQAQHGHSLDEQERLGRELIGERDDWHLVDVFSDPGVSGATEDRPGLRAMLARLDEFDVIVVWAMDRLTRDVELFAKLAKLLTAATVRIEAITAHVDLSTPEGEAMAGVSAVFGQFERKRIAERVRAALKARKLKGQHNGGPPPDGWMDVQVGSDKRTGKPIHERVHDPERKPVIEHLFELAERGVPDASIARQLNAEGYRTKSGRPWTRRQVQAHVMNAWHAGRVLIDGEAVEAQGVEPIVDPESFNRIQKGRAKRDLGAGQHVKGRPAHRHLLARLARCGRCGAPMFAVTSSYRRKDGTRARHYVCRGYHTHDGTCDVKVDAEAIDTAVLEGLPRLMPRFDEWIKQIEDRHAAERNRLNAEVERAREDRHHQARKVGAAERKWSEYLIEDEAKAEAVLPMVEQERQALHQAEARLRATKDARASVPEDVSHDRLLDFATTLRAVISGKLDGDRSVGELNRALEELFAQFEICSDLAEDTLTVDVEDEDALTAGTVLVYPYLRSEVAMRLLDEDETPAPPMEWIEALALSANTQA